MNRSPRNTTRFYDICKLQSDNFSAGDYWICIDEVGVSIAHQKLKEDTIAMISIPRAEFGSLIDWFNNEQELTP